MLLCVQIHKIPWDPSSSLKPLDIKHHIISVLRFEMRWMAKKWMKEFDVILRTDTELADKVIHTSQPSQQVLTLLLCCMVNDPKE